MKKNTKILVAILAIVVVCTSLYYNYENNDVNLNENTNINTNSENIITENSTENSVEEIKQDNNLKTISYKDDNGNKVEFQAVDHIVEPIEYGSGDFEYALLSEIPEDELFLYEHKDEGLILVLGDEAEYISKATNIIPPRFFLPQMFYLDFDGDNEKEILIDFYVGSGTSISFEELGMIEKSTSDDKVFEEMILFDNTTYSEILNDNMEYSISDNGSITLNFKPVEGAKDTTTYDLGVVEGAKRLDYQSNVRFKVEDNKIIGMHEIGVFQYDYASPTFGIGTVVTNVSYDGSKFTLSNFDYVSDEETTK